MEDAQNIFYLTYTIKLQDVFYKSTEAQRLRNFLKISQLGAELGDLNPGFSTSASSFYLQD